MMALAKERMGGGLSAGTAKALGGAYVSISAAGSAQGSATAIKASMVLVGSADGTKGVILPAGEVGDEIIVVNNSASSLKVYPDSGAAITVPGTGLGSANTAYTQTTYAVCRYKRLTTTQWAMTQSAFTGAAVDFTTVTANAIAGGDSSLGIDGQAAAQGGAIVVTGGTSSTSANAGGAVSIVGGTGGATGAGGAVSMTSGAGNNNSGATAGTAGGAASVVGAAGGTTATGTGGAGGDVAITAGAGGNASGAGTGGAGGTITLTPGTGGTTSGGTAGKDGVIIERGIKLVKQGAPTAKTTSATLTAAEVLAGIITVNQAAGGASAQQLPLATDMDTALPDAAAGDAFNFSVINISTVDAEDASVTTNTGWTLVGSMDVPANNSSSVTNNCSGSFRARKTGAGAWTLYRMS